MNNVNNTTFPGLLDLVSPHSCMGCGRIGAAICERCKKYILSGISCKPYKNIDGVSVHAAGAREGILAAAIYDFKYNSVRALKRPLAEMLNAAMPEEVTHKDLGGGMDANGVLSGNSKEKTGKAYLVPLPTATHHVRERGMDHTLMLAKELSRKCGVPVLRALIRAKNTVQVGADGNARVKQAKEAYVINPRVSMDPETTYILIDDVFTTGASITAAANKLKENGAKNVMAVVLAYSGD